MPLDPTNPAAIFVRALLGESPTPDQLEALDPGWAELVQAAQDATPVNRCATLLLAKAGVDDTDRLLEVLRPETTPPERPWPDPTPFGSPNLPRFPEEVLPDWLTIYVRSESRATQTPVDLTAMLALAVLSTAVAGPIVLNPWGDWIEPLNLFTMVVLPPGHRKSAIFNTVTEPLHQFEAEAARSAAPLIALARRRQHAAEQALIRAQDAAALSPDDDPHRAQLLETVERRLDDLAAAEAPVVPRLIADDCSPERLAMLLHEHGGRLAILSSEGGIFDLIAGRYSSTGAPNLDHYLKGHAGDPIVVDRVGRPGEIIPHPALTIGLAVQPEVLRGLIARPGFHGRGLLARFLYAVPQTALGRRVVNLEPVDPTIRNLYHRHIRALLHLTHPSSLPLPLGEAVGIQGPHGRVVWGEGRSPLPHPAAPAGDRPLPDPAVTPAASLPRHPSPITHHPPFVLPFDDFAADRLREFAEEIEPRLAPDGDLDPIVDWASKLIGAVARIAGLIHLASLDLPIPPLPLGEGRGEGLPPVRAGAVDAAIVIAEYLLAHAQAAYAAMGLDPAVANVPTLLAWIKRTGRTTFTRRDARHAVRSRIRSDLDLDEALDELERHGYIRLRPHQRRPGQGRPAGPSYDVHPSILPR